MITLWGKISRSGSHTFKSILLGKVEQSLDPQVTYSKCHILSLQTGEQTTASLPTPTTTGALEITGALKNEEEQRGLSGQGHEC